MRNFSLKELASIWARCVSAAASGVFWWAGDQELHDRAQALTPTLTFSAVALVLIALLGAAIRARNAAQSGGGQDLERGLFVVWLLSAVIGSIIIGAVGFFVELFARTEGNPALSIVAVRTAWHAFCSLCLLVSPGRP
jgi:hypothetical protein